MNCIIVDDEETARLIIEKLASQNALVTIKEKFASAIQAIKYLNQNQVDLIFLDIHMPEFNGFDFIRTLKHPPKIILTTSDRNFAIEAFEYKCIIDYLVKPVTQERFNKAINKAQTISIPTGTTIKNPENDLFVNIERRLTKIDIPSIYLIEAKGDYISIKTSEKNYIVHSTLKKIEKKLPADNFLKIHRSYIINVKRIIDIEDNTVLIEKDIVPVSRNKRPELLKHLNLL